MFFILATPLNGYEGKEEGIAEGEQQAKIAVAKTLKAGVSIDVIAEITGLSSDKIKQLDQQK